MTGEKIQKRVLGRINFVQKEANEDVTKSNKNNNMVLRG